MGKKKKSFYKKNLKPFVSDNKLFLAALGGMAAGISIANILGTEKAQQIVDTIEDSVKNLTQKLQGEPVDEPESTIRKANKTNSSHKNLETREPA
jgi:hypothetical protein